MPQLLHPRMADVYRAKVGTLCHALEQEESRAGAADAIRGLLEAIMLKPDGERLKITLKGDVGGNVECGPETGSVSSPVKRTVPRETNRRLWTSAET